MEKKKEILTKIARLESMLDHLMTEYVKLDQVLRAVGFEAGLITVRAAAQEVVTQRNKNTKV